MWVLRCGWRCRQAFLHPPHQSAGGAGKGTAQQCGGGNMWAHVPIDAAQKGALGRIRTLWRGVGVRMLRPLQTLTFL